MKNKKAAKEIAVLALPPLPKVPKVDSIDLSRIDEDLFTRFTPELKEIILEEGLDEGIVQATYTLHYPKFGDPSKGTYEVVKDVICTVKDLT